MIKGVTRSCVARVYFSWSEKGLPGASHQGFSFRQGKSVYFGRQRPKVVKGARLWHSTGHFSLFSFLSKGDAAGKRVLNRRGPWPSAKPKPPAGRLNGGGFADDLNPVTTTNVQPICPLTPLS